MKHFYTFVRWLKCRNSLIYFPKCNAGVLAAIFNLPSSCKMHLYILHCNDAPISPILSQQSGEHSAHAEKMQCMFQFAPDLYTGLKEKNASYVKHAVLFFLCLHKMCREDCKVCKIRWFACSEFELI